jgi:hypothetical protein
MRNLPKFTIAEITGNFEIDEDGNFIIVSNGRDKVGELILEDASGARVNKRGYLINQ